MNLLFDLDGTLTDPGVGITRCIQHALARMGRLVPAADDLLRFVGPPLRGTFEELLQTRDGEPLDEAIRLYRSALWGYGTPEELRSAQPGWLASSIGELRCWTT